MNDGEWEEWRAQWTTAAGPLPDVRAVARRGALRDLVGTWTLIALYAFGGVANLWVVASGHGDPIVATVLCTWALVVGASLLWIQRGSKVPPTDGPREALAFLERRVRIERAAAQVFRWAYAASIVFFCIYYRDLFADGGTLTLVARVCIGMILSSMLGVSFLAPRWAERRAARQRHDFELWRRWMEEQQL